MSANVHSHDSFLAPKYIILDSNQGTALNGTKLSKIRYYLKEEISINRNIDMFVQLLGFKFNNSFYNVDENNNVFYYGLASGGYSVQSITLPVKNYSIDALISYLNTLAFDNFSFVYDENTYKITITNTEEFQLFNLQNNCLSKVGFTSATHSSTANNLVSDSIINLQGLQILKIYTNLSSNVITERNVAFQGNLLEVVPITVNAGQSENFVGRYSHKIDEKSITYLDIDIKNEDNKYVHFNNIRYFLHLSIFFSYKKNFIGDDTLDDNLLGIGEVEVEEEKTEEKSSA